MADHTQQQSTHERHWFLKDASHGLVWLCFDKQGANTNVLSAEVLTELDTKITELERMAPTAVVIYSGKENGFIAGADVKEFTALETPEQAFDHIRRGQRVLARLAALPFTTVAMIHGFALGGGLELALACDYRIAADNDSTTLGFPEVKLGIHPGFGGSIRSVAKIGVFAAMDMMLTGRNVHVRKALDTGLIDMAIGINQLRDVAARLAINPPPATQPSPALKLLQLMPLRLIIASILKKKVAAKVNPKHYPAPFALIECWKRHAGTTKKAYIAEANSIAGLITGSACARNLVRVFLLQDKLKTLGKQAAVDFRHVHVVGAGTMGGDIAAWCALRGLVVTLQDREQRLIDPALARGRKLFEKRLKTNDDIEQACERFQSDLAGEGIAQADVVVEAIIEDVEIKQTLYRNLEANMQEYGLLATNTSSIQLETLTPALQHPDRLAGVHFFNPAAKMPLVEVILGQATSVAAKNKALAFATRIGKLPIPVKSSPGFLVNRILMPYLLEALTAVGEGIAPEIIDKAAVQFGMPAGPVELADTVGLDICLSVGRILAQAYGGSVPDSLAHKVKTNQLGRKSGQGYYQYADGKAVKKRVKSTDIPEDLTDRLILPMVNEAVACLREGIVENDEFIDAGVIFGTGFAPFRGGPIQYARDEGADNIRKRLTTLATTYGERFTPDSGWATIR